MKNNNWVSINSGLLPNDMEIVQVTYLGYYDEKHIVMSLLILKMEFGIGMLMTKKLK